MDIQIVNYNTIKSFKDYLFLKQSVLIILFLLACIFCYSQNQKNSFAKSKCDTAFPSSSEDGQRLLKNYNKDFSIIKKDSVYGYETSLITKAYKRTDYYTNNELLARAYQNLQTGVITAEEFYCYNPNSKLSQTFKWNLDDGSLTTKYIYNSNGNLLHEINYRDDKIVSDKD